MAVQKDIIAKITAESVMKIDGKLTQSNIDIHETELAEHTAKTIQVTRISSSADR